MRFKFKSVDKEFFFRKQKLLSSCAFSSAKVIMVFDAIRRHI